MTNQQCEVFSPFDQSLIQTLTLHNIHQAQTMLHKARAAFDDRRNWLTHDQKRDILIKLAQLVTQEADNFAMLIAREGGKPLIDAKIEVQRAIDGITFAAHEIFHVMHGTEIAMGHNTASHHKKAYSSYEPIGVVLAISAFNHPLNLIVHQVVPAIGVGCPIIIKPALTTPLSCIKLVELIHKAGLNPDWCQICICPDHIAQSLVTSDLIDFFTFIGSAKVGWYLKSQLAAGVRCALEHGGIAPVIIDKTADLSKTIPSVIKGGFYHAGQVCVSSQRIYIHNDIINAVADLLVQQAQNLIVGDPTQESTQVGPLILPREVDRVHRWVERVHQWVKKNPDSNTKILTGGKKLSDTTYAPTIIFNPPQDFEVSSKEIFGPVICLYGYHDHHDAIALANDSAFAFQAAVYSQDPKVIHDCSSLLNASSVIINDHSAFRVDWMPFGGRKQSGYGIGGIGYTMRDMTQIKTVIYSL